MNENDFWELIDKARDKLPVDSQTSFNYKRVLQLLELLNIEEIIEFQYILDSLLLKAHITPIALAAYIILNGFLSDDRFEDFKAWLISQGRSRYYAALANPETITEWYTIQENPLLEASAERLLYIAMTDAYKNKTGKEDGFEQMKKGTPYPGVDICTEADAQNKMPNLFKKYWDQDRMLNIFLKRLKLPKKPAS
ncbi:DUF4240 domain-containing protein [bacterium]|nr:DUF4240 domain-containing protein [bacterium]